MYHTNRGIRRNTSGMVSCCGCGYQCFLFLVCVRRRGGGSFKRLTEGAFGVVVEDPIDALVQAALAGGGPFFLEGGGRLLPDCCLAMPVGDVIVG
jgi:hypothetical protein